MKATAGVLFALLSAQGLRAAEPWVELKVPASRTSIVTNAGDKAGRKAAFQVAQFDRALTKRFPWLKPDNDTALVVFASSDETVVRSMAPDVADADKDNALSSYFIGATQHVGALRTDLQDPSDKERSAARGFYRGRAAYLVDRSLGKEAPAWLTRGLVAFLADSVVKEKEVLVGRLTAADAPAGSGAALPAAEFFKDARPADRRFDLQAGLFIHFLLSVDGGKNALLLDGLATAVGAKDSATAQVSLAKISGLYAGFPKYLGARKLAPLKRAVDPTLNATRFEARPIADADVLMRRAEVLFEMNRPVDTRGLLRQARAADPTLVRPLEIEAILFEREQRTAESKQAIEQAIQLGTKNAGLYYRLAQLQWSRTMPKATLEAVQKLLEKTVEFASADASALAYLAEVQSDLGLSDAALQTAERAASASPGDVYAQLALARAQWNAKQLDPALKTGKQAATLAKSASQKQSAQQFVTFATRNKAAQLKGAAPYKAQSGPPPAGAFGVTRSAAAASAVTSRVISGETRTDSGDASAISDCFAKRDDAACSRAVPSLEAACVEKQGASCVSLGSLYDGGFGVPRDRKRAAANFKVACDLGEKPGCARLAVLEAQGLGLARNTPRAIKTLETLCGEQVVEGCVGLAQILQRTGFAVDRDRAKSLLNAACDSGNAEACRLMTTR